MSRKPVAILGATGAVGQKFVELLQEHPWFEITALVASDRSVGKAYGELVSLRLPPKLAEMKLSACSSDLPAEYLFSGLPASVAGDIERSFAEKGYTVISNAKSHRFSKDVPLVIPEVNSNHLSLLANQPYSGSIITNPNCAVVGLAMALKPLVDNWGVEAAQVSTMQALSGAGFAATHLDIEDNIIPHIEGEEEKIETEPLKIFGELLSTGIAPHPMKISAQCYRVPVLDGHLLSVAVKLSRKADLVEVQESWNQVKGLTLPSAPKRPLMYFDEPAFPQPKHHRDLEGGMSVAIGGLRRCSLNDFKFRVLVHNTIRGAAGCALLNAELCRLKYLNNVL